MIDIKLWNKDKRVHIKFLEHDAALINQSIEKVFDFISPAGIEEQKVKIIPKKVDKPIEEDAETQVTAKENKVTPTKSRPRRLPLLSETRSTFNLSEIIGDQPDSDSCLCSYDCPECGFKATKYVKFGFRYTFCDECNAKLFLQPAGEGWGEKDEDGNTYVADKVYEAVKEMEVF